MRIQNKKAIIALAGVSLIIGLASGKIVMKWILFFIIPKDSQLFVTNPGEVFNTLFRFELVYSLFVWLALVCWITFYGKWKSKLLFVFSIII